MSDDDARRREEIRSLLAGGLETEAFPRADTPEQVQALVQRLQAAAGDLKAKLAIAGLELELVEHEGLTQHCETCMYFRRNQRHCELPELDIPVEPAWSCRLWRI